MTAKINYHIITIFPEIFDGWEDASIIGKAIDKWAIAINLINPRNWTQDKHHTIDDTIYGWWQWLLMKAQPIIDCVNDTIKSLGSDDFAIIYMSPSDKYWSQNIANIYKTYEHIIIVCGRYEGIDYRFEEYMTSHYGDQYTKISLWQYVLLGGEVGAMIVIESTARLVDGVIVNGSPQEESYDPAEQMSNLEYPQYTRPVEVYGMNVPEVLLNGNHAAIAKRRKENSTKHE